MSSRVVPRCNRPATDIKSIALTQICIIAYRNIPTITIIGKDSGVLNDRKVNCLD